MNCSITYRNTFAFCTNLFFLHAYSSMELENYNNNHNAEENNTSVSIRQLANVEYEIKDEDGNVNKGDFFLSNVGLENEVLFNARGVSREARGEKNIIYNAEERGLTILHYSYLRVYGDGTCYANLGLKNTTESDTEFSFNLTLGPVIRLEKTCLLNCSINNITIAANTTLKYEKTIEFSGGNTDISALQFYTDCMISLTNNEIIKKKKDSICVIC